MPNPVSVTRSEDFRAIIAAGRRTSSGDATVFVLPRAAHGGPTQLGLAVRADTAVARNRVKRRLRAATRAARVPAGTRIVVRACATQPEPSFQELVELVSVAAHGGRR